MKVILQQSVQKLGKAGDIVEAAPGYFRNFLQPRNLAVVATGGTLKKREEDLDTLRKKAEAIHQTAVELSEKINNLGVIKISAKSGEGGKLYGKITNKEIALELNKEVGQEVDKRLIKSVEEINALGSYKVQIKIAPDVQSEITVEVYDQAHAVA